VIGKNHRLLSVLKSSRMVAPHGDTRNKANARAGR
jgi:hypothetical protein